MNEITRIINAIEQGKSGATEKLLPLVYEELRVLAAQKMAQEKPGQTLQATPEVDELVLQLDAAYSGSSIDSPDQADQSQELTYDDIDTFPGELLIIPDADRHGDDAPELGNRPVFCLHRRAFCAQAGPISLTIAKHGRLCTHATLN